MRVEVKDKIGITTTTTTQIEGDEHEEAVYLNSHGSQLVDNESGESAPPSVTEPAPAPAVEDDDYVEPAWD
jgi:hypothetical protein